MQTQKEKFEELNANSSFPKNVEGYWRPAEKKSNDVFGSNQEHWDYPWPVVMDCHGYDKNLFIILLKEMEESPFTRRVAYRGISMHRLKKGEHAGSEEFQRNGWTWPAGYMSYIEMGVPPSQAFYEFVTCMKCESLPTYGR